MAFEVGDKCVVPALGVGVVHAIKDLEIEGTTYSVYEIRILDNGSTYTTPVDQADANGIRAIIPPEGVERVYEILRDRETPLDKQTWNRRYREYMSKIKTGDALEVSSVLRDLSLIRTGKALSFGERKMYDQASRLVIQELAVARDTDEASISDEIDALFEGAEPPGKKKRKKKKKKKKKKK